MSSAAPIGTKGVPRPEREHQIVAVAVQEFAARGYSGASIVAIATRAGISKPLVYQYFGSKDGLYLTCLNRVAGALLERLECAEEQVDDSAASRIHPLRAVFEALEPQPGAWRLLYDPSVPAHGPIADAASEYRRRTEQIATSGSARFLQVRGDVDALDIDVLSTVWMQIVDALVSWWLAHPDQSATQMTERCERLIGAVFG